MALTHTLTLTGGTVANTDTYTSAAIGTAASDRVVIALIQSNNAGTVTTCTIGGVTATKVLNNSLGADLFTLTAAVPTGTTADIVVNGSGGFQQFGVWAVYGGASLTITAQDIQATINNPSITCNANGCVVGACFGGPTDAPSWSAGISNEGAGFTVNSGSNAGQNGGGNFASGGIVNCAFSGAVSQNISWLVALEPSATGPTSYPIAATFNGAGNVLAPLTSRSLMSALFTGTGLMTANQYSITWVSPGGRGGLTADVALQKGIAFKADGGTSNSTTANQSTGSLTTSSAGAAGDIAVLAIANDNAAASGTGDIDNAVSAVVDNSGQGNVWIEAGEFCNSRNAAQGGATVSIWYCVLRGAINTGAVISWALSSNTNRDAQAASLTYFSAEPTAGARLEGTNATLAVTAGAPGSITVTTANVQCLRFRAIASESSSATALTKTAAFAGLIAQSVANTGTTLTSQGVRGEYLISSGTGTASNPTAGAGSVDHASLYIALRQTFPQLIATFQGAGALTANVTQVSGGGPNTYQISATFGGVGGLVFDSSVIAVLRPITATFAGTGGLTADVRIVRPITATFNGVGGLTANVTVLSGVIPTIPANPVLVPGHSLLTNLLACYLPGVYNGVPVSNIGPTLADGAGGAGTIVSTVEGPASRSNTLGSARGLTATAPSAFKTWTNFTILWRGLVIGTGDAFCPMIGVSIGDTDVSPYFMVNVSGFSDSYASIRSFYGDATASETTGNTDVTGLYGQIVDFVVTATVGGNVTFYVNGAAVSGTGSLTTISTSSSTSKIVVNQGIDATSRSPNASVNMAAFWDRALSSTEVANLHTNPYSLLQSGILATFAGVGGLSANVLIAKPVTATFNGVGGLQVSEPLDQLMVATATFAGVGGLSANVLVAKPITATFNGVGGLTASLTQSMAISATFAGVGGLSANALIAKPITATFNGVGGLSATLGQVYPIAATFAGVGSLSANATIGVQTYPIAAAFAGVGGLTADLAKLSGPLLATFAGVGGLTAQSTQRMAISATFAGVGKLSGDVTPPGVQIYPIAATFAGVGGLSAALSMRMPMSATFAGVGGLAANAAVARAISATFSGAGGLSASLPVGLSISATFASIGGLSTTLSLVEPLSATFAGVGSLAAAATQRMTVSVTFAGVGKLAGDATPPGAQTYSIAATFFGAGGLSANALVTKPISATLAGVGGLTATAAQRLGVSAAFAGVGGLTTDAVKLSAGTGALIAGSATLAGVGNPLSADSGVMLSGSATIAGSGSSISVSSSGAIPAAAAQIAGTGLRYYNATGALAAGAAQISSTTGTVKWQISGALTAGSAVIAGQGVGLSFSSSGVLVAQPVLISGTGARYYGAAGALAAGAAQIAGTASSRSETTSGALLSRSATLTATIVVTSFGAGALAARPVVLNGGGFVFTSDRIDHYGQIFFDVVLHRAVRFDCKLDRAVGFEVTLERTVRLGAQLTVTVNEREMA